jgi:hypothetical protein
VGAQHAAPRSTLQRQGQHWRNFFQRVLDHLVRLCKAGAPFVEKISHQYTDKDLIVLAVNVGESKKIVKK